MGSPARLSKGTAAGIKNKFQITGFSHPFPAKEEPENKYVMKKENDNDN